MQSTQLCRCAWTAEPGSPRPEALCTLSPPAQLLQSELQQAQSPYLLAFLGCKLCTLPPERASRVAGAHGLHSLTVLPQGASVRPLYPQEIDAKFFGPG